MSVREYSLWIEAAPEQVWLTYADARRVPDWQTGKPVIEEVQGEPDEPGSTYVSRRGRLVARTKVVSVGRPHELGTWTDAYLGLELEVTSRLTGRSDGTDLELSPATRWRRRLGPIRLARRAGRPQPSRDAQGAGQPEVAHRA